MIKKMIVIVFIAMMTQGIVSICRIHGIDCTTIANWTGGMLVGYCIAILGREVSVRR